MFEGAPYLRTLFREFAIDQSIQRFAFEASEDLLDGAELKGLLAEPGRVSRDNHFGMSHERSGRVAKLVQVDWKSVWASRALWIQSAGTARDFAHSLMA